MHRDVDEFHEDLPEILQEELSESSVCVVLYTGEN